MPGVSFGVDPGGDVLDADQDVQLEVGGLGLLLVGLGEEAVAVVVLVLGAELGQRVGPDVVVGHDQAVGRDERPRPAVVEPDRRRPKMLGPARRRLEAVPGLERAQRQVVEDPHPLVGAKRESRTHQKKTCKQKYPILPHMHRTRLLVSDEPTWKNDAALAAIGSAQHLRMRRQSGRSEGGLVPAPVRDRERERFLERVSTESPIIRAG